eukprot:TRINITY_DN2165_c0_g1_i1.p6 TRINITY_DN2165_c0_g1~~TRINITY_DN2165_c0_g1_i1.p6  ORF type:complete len:112 (+),score=18.90 TRINITY_DN2165_c0_g1_i1:2218-2553(+)
MTLAADNNNLCCGQIEASLISQLTIAPEECGIVVQERHWMPGEIVQGTSTRVAFAGSAVRVQLFSSHVQELSSRFAFGRSQLRQLGVARRIPLPSLLVQLALSCFLRTLGL